jgi:hypothetical protein
VAYPRPKKPQDRTGFFVSFYGGYGRYLKRALAPHVPPGEPFGRAAGDQVIRFLFLALKRYGIVEQVRSAQRRRPGLPTERRRPALAAGQWRDSPARSHALAGGRRNPA